MKRPQLKSETCPKCDGAGVIPAADTGTVMRRERESRGVTRVALVPHFGYSESYTIDLEMGRRQWSQTHIDAYRSAIEKAVAVRLEAEEKAEAAYELE